MMLSQGICY